MSHGHNDGIVRLVKTLQNADILEQPTTSTTLDMFSQAELERIQDYLYRIFPHQLHRQVHGFIDEIFQTATLYPPDKFSDVAGTDLMNGLGELVQPGACEDSFDAHAAALCDITFNKLSLFWFLTMANTSGPAFHRLCKDYKDFRANGTTP